MTSPNNHKISAELAAQRHPGARIASASAIAGIAAVAAGPAFAADPPTLSAGDTAWMLTSTRLS